jgi:tRNA-splicing ligase RtcB
MKQIKIYAEVLEDEALKQFNKAMSLECNVQGALMPDAHTGYTLPIGAVIKSKDMVFPAYVGYDIGCGMCAINLNITKDNIDLNQLKKDILSNIPIGFEKHKAKQIFSMCTEGCSDFLKYRFADTALFQIGTLGGGNHFIEIGESQNDNSLWIIIHSGSRGLGYKVADYYMKLACIENADLSEMENQFTKTREIFKEKNPEGFRKALKKYQEKEFDKISKNKEGHYGFNINSKIGKAYLKDMDFCLEFALENRKRMINRICDAISLQKRFKTKTFINRNHNHAELKDGFTIHRKGATHAEKGMLGIIPANMKDGSFIVKGKGNNSSMSSSSHGAGRVLSRKQAKEKLNLKEFHEEMRGITTNHNDNTIDESPKAYKNIFEVMELQKGLVEIIDRSIPILNIKG